MRASPDAVSLDLGQRKECRHYLIFETSHGPEKLWLASIDLSQYFNNLEFVLET